MGEWTVAIQPLTQTVAQVCWCINPPCGCQATVALQPLTKIVSQLFFVSTIVDDNEVPQYRGELLQHAKRQNKVVKNVMRKSIPDETQTKGQEPF